MRRAAIAGTLFAISLLASGCTVFFDYQYFRAIDAQEEAWYSNGDEPYLAFISFRSTPGVAGSTEVVNERRLDEIDDGIDDGDFRIIPESTGLFSFDDLEVVGLNGLLQGKTPELVGQLVVAIENDNTPSSYINDIMDDVRNELFNQLTAIIEPLDVAAFLADPAALADQFAAASAAVEAAAEPGFWEAVEIGLVSFGDPDDVIGFNFIFFLPVQPNLAPIVDSAFANLPDGITGGAFPTAYNDDGIIPRSYLLDFIGDHAQYQVTLFIGAGPDGFIPPPPPTLPPPWDPCDPVGPPPPPPRPVCP